MKLNKLPPRIALLDPPVSGWEASREGRSASDRGYGHQWRKLRERIMVRDHGLCVPCRQQDIYTRATEVDHITPKDWGGCDTDSNLQAICPECHKHKTAVERSGAKWTRAIDR